jgi:hypothetical protein
MVYALNAPVPLGQSPLAEMEKRLPSYYGRMTKTRTGNPERLCGLSQATIKNPTTSNNTEQISSAHITTVLSDAAPDVITMRTTAFSKS